MEGHRPLRVGRLSWKAPEGSALRGPCQHLFIVVLPIGVQFHFDQHAQECLQLSSPPVPHPWRAVGNANPWLGQSSMLITKES